MFHEYPKWVYPDGDAAKGVIVHDALQEAVHNAAEEVAPTVVTKTYPDGSTATGLPPLPDLSPAATYELTAAEDAMQEMADVVADAKAAASLAGGTTDTYIAGAASNPWTDTTPATPNPNPVVGDDAPPAEPTADSLRAKLDAAGIDYDKRWGVKRLQAALSE